jgi:hypothetical protein
VIQSQFLRKSVVSLLALTAFTALASGSSFVQNGSFETVTIATQTTEFQTAGVSNWTNSDYGELIAFPSWYTNGYLLSGLGLAGAFPQSSPDGGNFVVSDGDYHNSAIQQTITGLTLGNSYDLTFYEALDQDTETQTNPGPVQGQWQVTFGSDVQTGPTMFANGITPTFSPWAQQTMTFTASSTTEVLSFLSIGTGEPPMLMLDGISLVDSAPEPASIWLGGCGVALLAWQFKRRRKAA